MNMLIRKCKLSELEEKTFETYEENHTITSYEIGDPEREDALMIVDGIRVVIPEAGVSLRAGEYCVYDEYEDSSMPDFSIYLVYEENEEDSKKYLYWEQDTAQVAIYNHLYREGLTIDEVGEYECKLEIEMEG